MADSHSEEEVLKSRAKENEAVYRSEKSRSKAKSMAKKVRDIDLMREHKKIEKKYPHMQSPWFGSTNGKPNK